MQFTDKYKMALYKQGLNDGQIAKAVGCSRSGIWHWRKINNLPANAGQGGGRRPMNCDMQCPCCGGVNSVRFIRLEDYCVCDRCESEFKPQAKEKAAFGGQNKTSTLIIPFFDGAINGYGPK